MLYYKHIPVMAGTSVIRHAAGVTVAIGEPQIVAARDESPEEGTFTAPVLRKFDDAVYLNWAFDWDVLDPVPPEIPNGRVSRDGGLTWEKQTRLMPDGILYKTGENELTAWHRSGFEVPGRPGVYRVPTWKSPDSGRNWGELFWTEVEYPGTRGLDVYHPPEEFLKNDHNYARGGIRGEPPAQLESFFRQVSSFRPLIHAMVHPCAEGKDGTIYSLTYGRRTTGNPGGGDRENYWKNLNWQRYAVMMQVSRDRGRTWTWAGIPADGGEYEARLRVRPGSSVKSEDSFIVRSVRNSSPSPGFRGVVDFAPGDGFSEPSMVIFPDGEMLCALRTGSSKPLYCIRSRDGGRTWSDAELLSPKYVNPICGVLPKLVLLKNGILALCTGRPNCTIHFSKDRGYTWFLSETLFEVTSGHWQNIYSGSHANNDMIAVDDNTLLYVHDATRQDPSASNSWLRKAGHGLIIARRIEIHT